MSSFSSSEENLEDSRVGVMDEQFEICILKKLYLLRCLTRVRCEPRGFLRSQGIKA
jgi:hypothetical protein